MGEDWVAQVLSDRWFPAAVAYFLGLFTGWLIWSGARAGAPAEDEAVSEATGAGDAETKPEADNAAPSENKSKKSKEPISIKISALESEIKKAREMLAEDAEETAAFTDLISNLDEAVKRANGRLKLIIKSVKRAKPDQE